eukprot:gene1608-12733_t
MSESFRRLRTEGKSKSFIFSKVLQKVCNASYENKNLTEIPKEVFLKISLEKLNLSFNKIDKIDKQLESNKKLKQLNLSYNNLREVSFDFSSFEFLEELNLSGNFMENIDENVLKNSKNLKTLILDFCELNEIPKLIEQIKSLENLYFRINKLNELNFVHEYLKVLDLRDNNLTKLSNEIKKFKNLKVLNLDFNKLKELPDELPGELIEFTCSNNEIETDINCLNNLKSLEKLNLSNNKIQKINLLKLKESLKNLNLSSNKFKSLHNGNDLSDFKCLTELNLSKNDLQPNLIFPTSLLVVTLYLNNNLKEIKNLSNLVNLRYLNLSLNQKLNIEKLEIKNLKEIETLILGYQLKDISSYFLKDLSNLKYLKTLFLNGNKIKNKMDLKLINEKKFENDEIDFYVSNLTEEEENELNFSKLKVQKNEKTFKKNCYQSSSLKGRRDKMEDSILYYDFKNNKNELVEIYGLFDGHAGDDISNFLSFHFGGIFEKYLMNESNFKKGIEESFKEMTLKVKDFLKDESEQKYSGSTAVILIKSKLKFWIANLGDSRAVFGNKIKRISEDHKPVEEFELKRILDLGGYCSFLESDFKKGDFHGRLNQNLAISRSFGDLNYSEYISTIPTIYEYEYIPNEDVIILGCDGVFDVLNEQDIYNCVLTTKSSSSFNVLESSELIRDLSFISDSMDNITVIVIKL